MSEKTTKFAPARAEGAFLVVECDIPVDMTLGEWRRHCAAETRDAAASRPTVGGRLRRALRRAA